MQNDFALFITRHFDSTFMSKQDMQIAKKFTFNSIRRSDDVYDIR